MPIRQGRKVTELVALNSASLNTYVVGVDNNVTYKISLDVLEDAVTNIVSTSIDARLDALETYTASNSSSNNFNDLVNKPVIISSSQQITNFGFISSSQIINTSSFATTGSNIFVGNQYISGAVEIYDEMAVDAYPTLLQKFSDGTFGISNGRLIPADGIRIPGGQVQLILKNDANSTFDTNITNIDEIGLQISASGTNDAIMEIVGYSLNIQNTLTASINEGFIWVGNSENKTYLIPTSSFDERYVLSGSIQNITLPSNLISSSQQITDFGFVSSSFPTPTGTISGSAQITALGFVSSSQNIDTSSFATTGSNTFVGENIFQNIVTINHDFVVTGSSLFGNGDFDEIAPEKFLVIQDDITNYNVIVAKANTNNYSQVLVTNLNNGISASSDIVAQADNGGETNMYADLGINSSGYTGNGNGIGAANDAYVYGKAKNFWVGNLTTQSLYLFANPNGTPDIILENGVLNISGSLAVNGSITGSMDYSNLLNVPVIISSSQQITTFGFISSSQSINTGSFATTGSNEFSGSQYISGSIIFNNGTQIYQNDDDIYISSSANIRFVANGYNYRFDTDGNFYPSYGVVFSGDGLINQTPGASGDNINIVVGINDGIVLTTDAGDGDYAWDFDKNGDLTVPGNIYGAPNLATKGSNIFDGNQIMTGSLVVSGSTELTQLTISGDLSVLGKITGSIAATNGVISGSSQLTSSFDERYTLSGSVQPLPPNLVSSSAQITEFGFVSGSYETTGRSIISSSTQISSLGFAQLNGGNTFNGIQIFNNTIEANAITASSLTVTTFYAVSSSIASTSGSTSFGSINSDIMFVTGSIKVTNEISASTINGIGNVTQYSSSISNRINSLEAVTSSYETKGRGIISGSTQLPSGIISGSSQLTASYDLRYAGSASYLTSLNGALSSSNQVLGGSGIISGSSQLTSSYDLRYTLSGSVQPLPSGTVSGSSQLTSSFDARYVLSGSIGAVPAGTISGSAQITAFGFVSSSTGTPAGTISGSSQLTSSFDGRYVQTGSFNTLTSSFNSFTSSENTKNLTLASYTSSNDTKWTTLGGLTGSYATTGSNSFNGNQTITGSLTVSSVAIISSSLSIPSGSVLSLTSGSNLIIQNNGIVEITGSLKVSGSTTITGSINISSGSITMPDRPAFRVTGAGGAKAAVTRLSGSYLNVDYQQGSGWDNSTGTFTAPIAGLYQVNLVTRTNSNSLATISQLIVYKNNTGGTTGTPQIMIEFGENTTMNHVGGSTISKLAVGDTLRVVVAVGEISFDANDNFSVAYIG